MKLFKRELPVGDYEHQQNEVKELVLDADKNRDWDGQDIYLELHQHLQQQNPKAAANVRDNLACIAIDGINIRNDYMSSLIETAQNNTKPTQPIPFLPKDANSLIESEAGRHIILNWTSYLRPTLALTRQGYETYSQNYSNIDMGDVIKLKEAQDLAIGALGQHICKMASVATPPELFEFRSRIVPAMRYTDQGIVHYI